MTESSISASESPPSPTGSRLLLEALHRELGARFHSREGAQQVAHYGDAQAECRVLNTGAGLVDRSYRGRIQLVGPDRLRLLNGLITCPVLELGEGERAYGFFTSPQGKVMADAHVLELVDRTWIDLPAGLAETVGDHIRKYIVADQVEVVALADRLPLTLVGPEAAAVLGVESWTVAHGEIELRGVLVRAVVHPVAGQPAVTLWVEGAAAEELARGLLAGPEVQPVGEEALDALRVEAGVPAFGRDFGSDCLPQETGLEGAAVSYEKGCYIGQEVVARVHYRGRANRQMCRLELEVDAAPVEGTPLVLEDREVGRIGSVARTAKGDLIALALVHRRGAEAGTRLEIAGGGSGVVRELP